MNTAPVSGALGAATFTFDCTAPDLCAYARIHLEALVRPAATPAVITSVLRWHDGQPPAERPTVASAGQRVDRFDRDLYLTGDTLSWFRVDDLRDLRLRFTWQDERLTVHGDFYHRLGGGVVSDRLRRLAAGRRQADLRRRRFTTLLYYLVYYPCWWWLEHMRDLHPIHAAGVTTERGAILLAGASGIGKSSLTAALATAPGVRLLADSFVLQNGTDVVPVREPILLDDWSRKWLGPAADWLRPIDWRYGLNRRGYAVPAERLADSGRAVVLLLPRRASESYVRPITPREAHQRLSALDMIINDLRRYWAFAAVLEQLAPRGLVAQREEHLARLTSLVPAYEVGLTAEMTSATAVETILQLAHDPRQRLASVRARS